MKRNAEYYEIVFTDCGKNLVLAKDNNFENIQTYNCHDSIWSQVVIYWSQKGQNLWSPQLHKACANPQYFDRARIMSSVPDGEIWEVWKFVRCDYAIWNSGVL